MAIDAFHKTITLIMLYSKNCLAFISCNTHLIKKLTTNYYMKSIIFYLMNIHYARYLLICLFITITNATNIVSGVITTVAGTLSWHSVALVATLVGYSL